jgi:hypothetical protein
MQFDSLSDFLSTGADWLAKGPVGLIFAEDTIELASTIAHQRKNGFRRIIVLGKHEPPPGSMADGRVAHVVVDLFEDDAVSKALNACIDAVPEVWFGYCYNAEYLYYPFCEHRTIGELIGFCEQERRASILTYVVDLYAGDLTRHPGAVALDEACLDSSGYYALARYTRDGKLLDRQMDFFGGLRWRFEEHVPYSRRRIDRIAVFKATKGLAIGPDHLFNMEEYNTFQCEWHHSPTAALCSFRTAKALMRNPGSRSDIRTFTWRNSVPFSWNSHQLLDLGLMEPGQWF